MRKAGGTAGSLKEVAAKVHCVARAMMAGVPKAPGVKVLGISFIRKEGKRVFLRKFWCKISGGKSTLVLLLVLVQSGCMYPSLSLFALFDMLVTLFQIHVVNILLVCEHKL